MGYTIYIFKIPLVFFCCCSVLDATVGVPLDGFSFDLFFYSLRAQSVEFFLVRVIVVVE